MRKLISLALALVMILSLSTVAFADEGESTWDGNYTATAETTFNEIVKTYTSENNVVVNETLSFTSTAKNTNPDGGTANLTVADLEVSSLNPGTLAVTIPSLSMAGTYEWTIKEAAGNTAGVTYSNAEVHVIVLVEYDNTNHALKIANTTSYIKEENGKKAKTFDNTFKSGEFNVAKEVTGNMANQNDEFEITVTLTKPAGKVIGTPIKVGGQPVAADQWVNGVYTTTLTLSHADGATTFSNIPVDVTVTVTENKNADKMNGYEYVSTKVGEDDFNSLTIGNDTNAAIVVLNKKDTTVDTGISMDSVPYVLLLAVATMGLAVLFTKKRMMREF